MAFGLRLLRIVACALAVAALAGCTTMPRQAFNKEAQKDIKTIGLIEPAFSGEYTVNNLGHPGLSFGLVGGLVAAAHMQSQTSEFTVKAKDTKFDAAAEFYAELEKYLVASGYTVKRVPVKRPKVDWLQSYAGLDPEVDAYLDPVLLYVGYLCASATTPYLPAVNVKARLVKRADSEILYSELVSYGYQAPGRQAVSITSEQKYQFPDFSDLKENVPLAGEGLKVGLPMVADRIGGDLKRAAP